MSKFRDSLIKGFRSTLAYKGFSDETIIDNLKVFNICPEQIGLDGGFNSQHCTGDCDLCWYKVHRAYSL